MKTNLMDQIQREIIGFHSLFKNLETPLYPPHNVVKTDEGYSIEIAVAGFQRSEIEVTQDEYGVVVKGLKDHKVTPNYVYQGIAHRQFKKTFPLAPHIKVTDVTLEDGMLYIDLAEHQESKARKLTIN